MTVRRIAAIAAIALSLTVSVERSAQAQFAWTTGADVLIFEPRSRDDAFLQRDLTGATYDVGYRAWIAAENEWGAGLRTSYFGYETSSAAQTIAGFARDAANTDVYAIDLELTQAVAVGPATVTGTGGIRYASINPTDAASPANAIDIDFQQRNGVGFSLGLEGETPICNGWSGYARYKMSRMYDGDGRNAGRGGDVYFDVVEHALGLRYDHYSGWFLGAGWESQQWIGEEGEAEALELSGPAAMFGRTW